MADIFISYASEDRDRVEPLAKTLEEHGWSVFWDRTIPVGKTWRQVIYTELNTTKCVLVIWTENSRNSKWVLAEVNEAYEKDILTQILFDNTKVPFPFRQEQAADLRNWKAGTSHLGFDLLLGALTEIVGPSPLKIKEAEQRKTEEKRQRQEEEKLKREEAEAKRKTEEEQKRREAKAEIKPDKPEHDAPAPSEPRKSRNALIFGSVAGVIMLLMVVIGLNFTKRTSKEQAPPQVLQPYWVTKGSGAFDVDGSKVFYGVGVASGMKNKALLNSTADNRARAEIAKILEIFVASLTKDYMSATTDGDMSASSEEQHVETALKTFTKTTLSGAPVIDRWMDPADQTMYSLCAIDLVDFTNTLDEYKELDEKARDFVRKNAERLHNDLERQENIEKDALQPPLGFTQMPNPNDWGLIIGIEDYVFLPNVYYAKKDALIVEEYFIKVLGVPEENIISLLESDATKARMERYLKKYFPVKIDQDSTLYVYFAGHGAADMAKEPYLIPYDGDIHFIDETAYKLVNFYKDLNNLKIQSVYVFLDACFSGVAARTAEKLVKGGRRALISSKDVSPPSGSIISLNAASSGQMSNAHPEKEHGLFTYFLLRALNGEADSNSDGVISVNEIYGYVKDNVTRIARRMGADQTPVLMPSPKKLKDVTISKVPR